jgi:large subunit ribosomal protein L27
MGRDHTIYATESGYVKYYKDPEKHPKRQYIGVVFEREMVLPLPRNSMRRRRLGMTTEHVEAIHTLTPSLHGEGLEDAVEVKLSIEKAGIDSTATKIPKSVVVGARKGQEGRTLTLRPGYMYREANWEIGRAAERAKVKVREFKPRDRWTAWRKTSARKAKNAERKGLTRRKK